MWTLLFVLLVLLVITALPVWSYRRNWGYLPTGVLGTLLLILIVLLLLAYL